MCDACSTGLNEWEKPVMLYIKRFIKQHGRISSSVLERKFKLTSYSAGRLLEKYEASHE